MANPQVENGSTDIANELLEAIYSYDFNGTELSIILCILRYTYGFHRKEHELSLSFIAKAIKKSKMTIYRTIKKLIKNNVLIEYNSPTYNDSRIIGINKDYSIWNCIQSTELNTVYKTEYRTVYKTEYQETKKETKNNIYIYKGDFGKEKTKNEEKKKVKTSQLYEEIISNEITDDEVKEVLLEFLKMRKLIKKPMTDRALKQLINKLKNLSQDKKEQIKILDQSIINNWSSVYPLKKETYKSNGYIVRKEPEWFDKNINKTKATKDEENEIKNLLSEYKGGEE